MRGYKCIASPIGEAHYAQFNNTYTLRLIERARTAVRSCENTVGPGKRSYTSTLTQLLYVPSPN